VNVIKTKLTSRWWNLRRKGFEEKNPEELQSVFLAKRPLHLYLGNKDVFELQDHIKASEISKPPCYFHLIP
jgi:hypothetical protein